MTIFEYLAIAFGLLYSVAALRVFGGLPSALAPNRRYWLHLLLTLVMLLLIAASFWTFWSLREVTWTYRGFLVALLVPGLLYYCAAVLVPENPEHTASWRDHYFAVHRRWYAGFGVWGAAAAVSATVNLGMSFQHPARIVHVTAVLAGCIGSMSSDPRIHAGLIVVLCWLGLGAVLSPAMEPGWLAQP
jgi:hypothetical protein